MSIQYKLFPIAAGEQLTLDGKVLSRKHWHAQATGEFRAPRRAEWYISGAIPEAYQAPNDLSTAFHIARLVKTKS